VVNIVFILIAWALQDNAASIVMVVIGTLALIVGQLPIYFYRHKISDIEADMDVQEEIDQSLLSDFKSSKKA
jgi:hypothetical protein